MSLAIDTIAQALTPPTRLSVSEWGEKYVNLPFSARAPRFDPDSSPWLGPVMDAVGDNENKEVVCLGAVGSGKTTLYEVLIPYFISEDPGPILCAMQTEAEAKSWAETRLHPVLNHCAPLRDLMPKDRTMKRKTEVLFPHMFLMVVGANLSSLQSKSIRFVLLDETWIFRKGMINEARKRTHDRWNSRVLLVSQAGNVGDEMDEAWEATDKAVWEFVCPDCGESQPYKWNQVKWEIEKDEDDEYIWSQLDETTRYECIHCEATFPDTPESRRALTSSGSYARTKSNHLEGHRGFQWSALAVWWIPWRRLVREWLQAVEAKRDGQTKPLQQFYQKRLAEPWEEDYGDARAALTGSGYRKADYFNGELWEGEVYRFATVDKQRDHFWMAVRAWKSDGSSRLLWEGKVITWEMIGEHAERFKIQPKLVFIDAQYDTPQVYQRCSENDWTALHGSRQGGFKHKAARKNGKVSKFYSQVQQASLPGGKSARYIFIASGAIKDVLSALRNGRGADWEIPDDVSEQYRKQIDSEVKKEFVNSSTKETSMRWVPVRRDNHLWDCEVYQVAAAMMLNLIVGEGMDVDTAEE